MYTDVSGLGWPGLTSPSGAVDAVLRDVFAGSHSPASVVRVLATDSTLADHRSQVEWTVDGEARRPNDLAAVLFATLGVLNRTALDHDTDRLHLHAGLVGHGATRLLVAGSRGAGKTTLVASLLDRGMAYGTDEMVALERDGVVEPLRKPLGLKAGALARFDHVRGLRHPALRSWPIDRPQAGIPPRWLPEGTARASAILLPERSDEVPGPPSIERVSGARAVRLLVEHTFDFDRFGPARAVQALADLVRRTPVLRLTYRDATDAARFLADASLPTPVEGAPVVFVPADEVAPPGLSASAGVDGTCRRVTGSFGVALEDGGVVWCPEPSRLVELSGPGFAAWVSADGRSSAPERAAALGASPTDLARVDRSLVENGVLSELR